VVELRAGAVLAGKLRLTQPLGQGGMGVVWAARHLGLDTDVAVKVIRPDRVAANPALIARFEREAKTAARIAHPHVVRVMDFGAVDDAVPYIVMELLSGFSLAELIERGGRLSLATARTLVGQVGSALELAHERGVVHRDIKPHNVFITEGSKDHPLFVKVLDFGVAKMVGDTQVPGASAALTETGMVLGSPPYMSPEQLEGRHDVDLRSDLWSLGVITYETLTGALPFQGGSFVAVGAAVLKGKYRPASELRPDLPSSIDDWFAKALCVDPDGRFQSAMEMVAAFERHESDTEDVEPPLLRSEEKAVELATTVAAPAVVAAAEESITASHAPVARRALASEPLTLPPSGLVRSRRWRVIAGVAGVALVGAGISVGFVRAGGSGSCPAGMVMIAGARFQMGSAEDAETPTDETPQHAKKVEAFCLDTTEVTVKAYAACDGCERAPRTVEFEGLTPKGRSFESGFCNGDDQPDHPMNCIDWHQAKAYCEKQGKRLPTEAEWELAARGNEGRFFPWGDEPPSGARLNACGAECSRMLTERRSSVAKDPWPAMYFDDDAAPATAPVGGYRAGATGEGVLDLAGNVWEWTESAYCPYGNVDCGDSRRVLRGGGWDTTEASGVRATRRYPSAPSARGRSTGFRCAKNP
jgi:eukaryotic-like serine/threonine-protein kinase